MRGGTSGPAEPPSSEEDGFYAVILTCAKFDRFGHNGVFAKEITVAFEKLRIPLRELDYRVHLRQVFEALNDRRCLFFLCFNGFGSELMFPLGAPGHLKSSFEVFGKPLFDLMHDCPSGEPMAHQIESRSRARWVLLTDYGYVQDAQELGFPNIRFVPSITFPYTLSQRQKVSEDRSIKVLLPMGMQLAKFTWDRHRGEPNYKRRIYREIFAAITDKCGIDLQLDPRIETRAACREAGVAFDIRHADSRFLLTSVADAVKFQRRHSLFKALQKLPVTVMADRQIEDRLTGAQFEFTPAKSFSELLHMMANSQIVLCPLPHMTGFHERALGAFSAGAVVVAAPNAVLDTNFVHGRDMLIYRNTEEVPDLLTDLLAAPDRLQEIGERGRSEAMTRFSPSRLAEIILAQLRLHHGLKQHNLALQ